MKRILTEGSKSCFRAYEVGRDVENGASLMPGLDGGQGFATGNSWKESLV